MRGWLIYEPDNIPRNTRFIEFFIKKQSGSTRRALVKTEIVFFGHKNASILIITLIIIHLIIIYNNHLTRIFLYAIIQTKRAKET